MVRSIVLLLVAFSALLSIGAHSKVPASSQAKKRSCSGYSVIEVDKGIDCNGDTIKLIKVNGFFERASNYHDNAAALIEKVVSR